MCKLFTMNNNNNSSSNNNDDDENCDPNASPTTSDLSISPAISETNPKNHAQISPNGMGVAIKRCSPSGYSCKSADSGYSDVDNNNKRIAAVFDGQNEEDVDDPDLTQVPTTVTRLVLFIAFCDTVKSRFNEWPRSAYFDYLNRDFTLNRDFLMRNSILVIRFCSLNWDFTLNRDYTVLYNRDGHWGMMGSTPIVNVELLHQSKN